MNEISSDSELPRDPKRGLEMMGLMKSLLFYPMRVLGGLLVLTGKILGGFFVLGFVLIGVLKLAGELDVAWWIVAACGVVGTLSLALTELYVQLLLKLQSTGQDRAYSGR